MSGFIEAFLLIFLAEMGDKTQLLAFAFSTKYKTKQVLLGVMIGSFLNHGVAVALAQFITAFAKVEYLQLLAAVMFIVFGIMSLRIEYGDEEEETVNSTYGPIFTVAAAFFVGELGDKTQLTAMTLGLTSSNPILILAGTTIGMVAVSSLGIVVGRLMGKKIPEVTMKFIAGGVFLLFGCAGLLKSYRTGFLSSTHIIITVIISTLAIIAVLSANKKNRELVESEVLLAALNRCRNCHVHSSSCSIAEEIETITKSYLGMDVKYMGSVIGFFESMKAKDPRKAQRIEKRYNS